MVEEITLQRHSFQVQFIRNAKESRIAAFCGGLQGGKTIAGVDALAELLWVECLMLPKQAANAFPEVWMLSKNYSMAEVVWNAFVDRWGDMVMTAEECKRQNLFRGDSNVHWLRPGPRTDGKPIRCRVRTVEDPESLRGTQNLLVCLCDEAAYWKEMAWLNIRGRGIVTPTRYLITTTPKGKNWFFRLVSPALNSPDGRYTDKGVTVSAVRCRSMDNPWASQEYIADLKTKFGESYALQELDALFVENAGIVYDFDRTLHMKRPPSNSPDEYEAIVFGVDPGYGDPYAVGIWAKTAEGEWWLLEEYYKSKVTTDDLIGWFQRKVERWKPRAIYVDKRRPSDWLMLKKHLGGKVKYVGPNIEIHSETDRRVIMPQVRYCQQLLKTGKLFVDPRCLFTAEEFEQYHFKDADERNSGENPVDWKNHCVSGDSWIDCVDGRHRIEDLVGKENVYVWAFDGEIPRACRARDIRKTRDLAPVVKVTFDNTSLVLTEDHLVMRKDGSWVEAGKLKRGDRVRALYKSVMSAGYLHLRTGRGRRRYESAHRLVWESINGAIPRDHVVHHADENILNNHPDNLQLMTRDEHIAHHQPRWAEKARHAARNPKRAEPRESICAYCEKPFVDTNIPCRARKTCSPECWTGLRIHNHRVLSVEPYGVSDVYNMEVDGLHNFVANGVCVHNCMDALRYGICSYDEVTLRDRRQRLRGGDDLMPRVGAKKGQKVRYCTGQEYLLAMHKKMDSDEQKSKGRRARTPA